MEILLFGEDRAAGMSNTHCCLAGFLLIAALCGCTSVDKSSCENCPEIVHDFIKSNGEYDNFVSIAGDRTLHIQEATNVLNENRITPFEKDCNYLKSASSVFVFSDKKGLRCVVVWLFDSNKGCGDRRICGVGFHRKTCEVLFYGQGNY